MSSRSTAVGSSCATRAAWRATSISPADQPSPGSSRSELQNEPRQGFVEFSAGGVVVRDDGHIIVIVPVKRAADGRRVTGLPKGHPEGGESAEQAAAREVAEEAGVQAELVDALGDVSYHYERRGRTIAKTVRFYEFRYLSGDVADHDHEIEEASWMTPEEALGVLTYDGEREIVQRLLSRRNGDR